MFDVVLIVDWSARSTPSPKSPAADAIWIAEARGDTCTSRYLRTRSGAFEDLKTTISAHLSEGRRVLAGFDFAFGYPDGFACALTGSDDPFAVWEHLAAIIEDRPDNTNNRFEVAAAINRQFPGVGPLWGRPDAYEMPDLPTKGTARGDHGQKERRVIEDKIRSAQPVWKLFTTGSVGSQVLLGLPWLAKLRAAFADRVAVWPFQDIDAPLVLAEVYPSLLAPEVDAALTAEPSAIKDDLQVRLLARALVRMNRDGTLPQAFEVPDIARREGWILGAASVDTLRMAARPEIAPPVFDNDCFALPPGVDWVPVDVALARLSDAIAPVTRTEDCTVTAAQGRILAQPVHALRANPPAPNAAVDGYGFAHASIDAAEIVLPLTPGRAAAGAPFDGRVPAGTALRILTGAVLPAGVDTVVLEEDTRVADGHVAFAGPVKIGANTRKAGEDIAAGDTLFPAGHRLRAPDLALLSVAGVAHVEVHAPLSVGVLSTGDELVAPGGDAGQTGIFDANRPMLLSLIDGWGHDAVDLGIAADRRSAVRDLLDDAASRCDAILTSGGASAGDEDHISALLNAEGGVTSWRIALKPGRPLLLGAWNGVPLFGLPGNPVAALVCALLFARPALARLAGADWSIPQGVTVPAAFSKSKKPERREYLRARLDDQGRAEVFASEGSGRVSGLSWATGLVELPDGAAEIRPGDPVRFLPYTDFGV